MVMDKNLGMRHLKNKDGRSWQCEFCDQRFEWSVAPKKFFSHLTGVGGSATTMCELVPDNVKDELLLVLPGIDESASKKRKTTPCSSNEVQKPDMETEGSQEGGDQLSSVGSFGTEGVGRASNVFVSFSEDTGMNFTDHLYYGLRNAGINVFRDKEDLQRVEDTACQTKQAIQRSILSMVVLSKDYAFSRRCLEELMEIMECKKSANQIVFPVFYYIDPSEVRRQLGPLAEAFAKHEQRYSEQRDKVAAWRAALTEVANLSGFYLNNESEAKVIEQIVTQVSEQLKEI